MSTEAIILAGGLGTRLRAAVPDLPKCMAPVAGKPFIHHVITYLQSQQVEGFIFSLGYMHEVIETYVKDHFNEIDARFVVEEEPLGTGGAIKQSCKVASSNNVLVFNGDTMFKVDTARLLRFHEQHRADCSLALKPMQNFERYGVVEINEQHYIQSFKEKQFYEAGLINGGVYALNIPSFLSLELPAKFSFEKDYLEKQYRTQKLMGLIETGYFIDIGIPEDLEKANREL